MNYKLNPCNACLKFYKKTENSCDINTINNCLSETVAAFKNVSSNSNFTETTANIHIKDCLNNIMKSQGRNECNFQLQNAPVFVQTPHYFPQLLRENGNPDTSFLKCIEIASKNMSYPKESIKNCLIDYMSIEKENLKPEENIVEKYSNGKTSRNIICIFILIILIFLIIVFCIYKNQQHPQM